MKRNGQGTELRGIVRSSPLVAIAVLVASVFVASVFAPNSASAANVVSLSGVLRAADGKPVHLADVILTDLDDPTNTASVWTTKSGAYFLLVRAASRFRLQVRSGISGAAGTDTIIVPTATFTTSTPLAMLASRSINLALPPLRKVTINITDPDDNPVQGAVPLLNTEGTATGFELADGISFDLEQSWLGGNRNLDIPYIRGEIYDSTNALGNTVRWSFPGTFTTPASGMPPIVTYGSVRYPPINGSRYTQQINSPITIDATTGNATVNIQRPRLSTLSGVLRTADGKPVHLADVILTDLDDPTNTGSVWTNRSGAYSLRVRSASRFRLQIRSGVSGAAGTDTIIVPNATFTTSAPLALDNSRSLDLTLPPLRKVTINITDHESNAVKGAEPRIAAAGTVTGAELSPGVAFDLEQRELGGNRNLTIPYIRGEIYRTTSAYGTTTRWSYPGNFSTPATGVPPFVYATVRYPSVFGFRYEQKITDPIDIDVSSANAVINVQRPELATFSGVLRAADGKPVTIADIILTDLDDPTNTASMTTKSNGAYFLLVRAAARFELKVRSGFTGATGTSTVVLPASTFTSSDPLSLLDSRVLNLTLPPLRKVTIRVADADDNPIAGAEPTLSPTGTATGFSLADGVNFGLEQTALGGNRNLNLPFIRGEIYRTTNALGNATRWSYAGSFTTMANGIPPIVTYGSVRYPAINGFRYTQSIADLVTINTESGDATVTIQSDNFATIDSAGSLFGDIAITAPDDTVLDDLTTSPVIEPEGVPEGAYVLAGDIEYSVTDVDPGASVDVTIALPSGATVSHIGKIVDNGWTAAPPDRIISKIGNRFTVRLTDGGWGDADGAANGVIVDPLVPVGPCKCSTPGTPGRPTASIGDRSVTLRWAAAATRGAAIRDHLVTYATSPTGPWTPVLAGTCATRPVRSRVCTVTGLTPGTAYWFRAAAINAKGRGANSLSVRSVAATVPGTVTTVTATPTSTAGRINISWGAAPANGAAIRRYEYAVRVVGAEAWGAWRSARTYRTATLTGLTPGVSYEVRVRATNAVGSGEATQTTFVA